MENLDLTTLKHAVAGDYAAIRRVTKLNPATEWDKVYPPTYEGGEYAQEARKVRAENAVIEQPTVLLDSVQSQANRLELALLRGYDAGELKFPLLCIDFTSAEGLADVGRLTALEAPHRIADAIFRDSEWKGEPFRASELGKKLDQAKTTNATPVFELCPTALVFGFWDSTGPKGGLGAKVQRALVSEIVAYNVAPGVRASSRIDPLQIPGGEGVEVYKKAGGGWTTNTQAAELKDGAPVKYGAKGRPSEINHGNITPSLRDKDGNPNPGGFTIDYAIQSTVLSLAALRRLRFPLNGRTTANQQEIDNAARTVLAALGLAAICWLDREGFDLRSRCLLDGKPGAFQLVGGGQMLDFALDHVGAARLLDAAAAEAQSLGLPWSAEPITLKPSVDLAQLVLKGRQKTAAAAV